MTAQVQLDERRAVLERAREALAEGQTAEGVADIDAALTILAAEPLLTPAEAAAAIGIEEPLIVALWCRQGKLRCEQGDDGFLVPRAEAERFRDADEAERMRWSDAMHLASAELGLDRDMTEEEMAILSETRPGRLPWQADRNPGSGGDAG